MRLKILLFMAVCVFTELTSVATAPPHSKSVPANGFASWYGEEHRGKLMANGHKFNPDDLTAASWCYPLGTRVRVTLAEPAQAKPRSVLVTITDRGPAWHLVREGRIIDLGAAAFHRLGDPDLGLVPVRVERVN